MEAGGAYSIYHVFTAVGVAVSFASAWYVLYTEPKSGWHRSFFAFGSVIALWQFQTLLLFTAESVEQATYWYRFLAWDPLLPIIWIFYWLYIDNHPWLKSRIFYTLIFLPTAALIFGLAAFPSTIEVVQTATGWSWNPTESAHWINQARYIHMYAMVTLSGVLSIRIYFRHRNEELSTMIKYLAFGVMNGLLVSLLGAIANDVIYFANLGGAAITGTIAYGIIRHGSITKTAMQDPKLLIDTVPIPAIILNTSNTIIRASGTMQEFGFDSEEMIGTDTSEILTTVRPLSEIQNGQYESTIMQSDGKKVPVMIQSTPFFDEFDEREGAVLIIIDASTSKQAVSNLRQKQESMREMNAIMKSLVSSI